MEAESRKVEDENMMMKQRKTSVEDRIVSHFEKR